MRNTFIRRAAARRGPTCACSATRYTLRYVPLREDVRDAGHRRLNAPEERDRVDRARRGARDRRPRRAGCRNDRRHPHGARAGAHGATGIVTDGGVRDSPALARLRDPDLLPDTNRQRARAAALPLESNVPIACGGVLVLPGDVIVGDSEGVIVVPSAMAEDVAWAALEQEEREEWALLERVSRPASSIGGVYPLGAATSAQAEFEAWRAAGANQMRERRAGLGADARPSRHGSSERCAACARGRRPGSCRRRSSGRDPDRSSARCSATDAAPR